MSKITKTIKGCEFEIWDKSIRMVFPITTPVIFSPEPMSTTGIPETYADKIIDTMNAGIELYAYGLVQCKSYRIGK